MGSRTIDGRRLARCLDTPAAYRVLGPEGTWRAGGCSLLVVALKRLLGSMGEALFVASSRHPAEHSVLRVGRLYYDADGAQTKKQLLDKMAQMERVPDPHLVPFDLDRAIESEHIYSEEQAALAVRLIERCLGTRRK